MGGKRRSLVEGTVYFFAIKRPRERSAVRDAIETSIVTSKCGRIVGSGVSLFDAETYCIEFKTSDPVQASASIERVCAQRNICEYEIVCD